MIKAGTFVKALVDIEIPGKGYSWPAGYRLSVVSVNEDNSLVVTRDMSKVTVLASEVTPSHQVWNGIHYSADAEKQVIDVLERYRSSRTRLHIHKGYTRKSAIGDSKMKVGEDWLEEFECEGRISNSWGPIKIPILVPSSRSTGGMAIEGACIVKITTTTSPRKVLYQHPEYHHGEVSIREIGPNEMCGEVNLRNEGYTHAIDVDGKNHANFRSRAKAERWVKKMGLTLS